MCPSIPPLAAHILLVAAAIALGAAGLRTAAAVGGSGAMRVLGAAAIAATAACLWVLALGVIGLGGSAVALTAGALLTWGVVAATLPPAAVGTAAQLRAAWARLPAAGRIAVGTVAGAGVALAAWCLHSPALVGDGLAYHVPVVVTWVQAGDAPAMHPVTADAPLEAYPLTAELLVAWASGIAHSFVPISLANPVSLGLLAVAGWAGLRAIGASRPAAALAVAAVATSPLLVSQLNTFTTDLPTLAWLAVCAALCAGSVREPGLLVTALLAGGLAVGTKTTTLPLAAACLIAAAIVLRGRLRPIAVPLAVGAAAAAVVGGIWYARNLVLHGSPFWPFVTTPWGDPAPFLFAATDERLLGDPASAGGRLDDYGRALWGGVALLGGGALAWLASRSRPVMLASAATVLALLIWANAPFTAFPEGPIFDALQGGSTRYLLPAVAAGAVALALAASAHGTGGQVAAGVLAVALAANLVGDARLGFIGDFEPAVALEVDPMLPSAAVPLAGAALGAVAVGLAIVVSRRARVPSRPWAPLAAGALGVALVGALLAHAASGYVERSTALASSPPGAAWLVRAPGYADGDTPVAVQARIIGTLAGDRLRHPLTLLGSGRGCEEIRAAADAGWVVVNLSSVPAGADDIGIADYARAIQERERATAACLEHRPAAYSDGNVRIYPPDSLGSAGRTGIAKKSTVSGLSAKPPS